MSTVRHLLAGLALFGMVACSGGGSTGSTAVDPSVPETTTTETTVPATTTASTATESTAAATTTSTLAPLAMPIMSTGNSVLDRGLVRLARFVEAQRGHAFLHPVDVQLLGDAAFERVVLAGFDSAGVISAMNAQRDLLVILELLPADVDYIDLIRVSTREGVVGFYIPDSDSLFIRGTELTPLIQTTVVHELTHAIDDQWFDLGQRPTDADNDFALGALAEGSSTWVEDKYVDQMSAADIASARRESDAHIEQMDVGPVPLPVSEISDSVYSLGNRFVSVLISKGGMAALDDAFRSPPVSTEQLLHPERYAQRQSPVPVPEPATSGTVRSYGVLGELSLIELLNAELAPADARTAAEGWGGDQYVIVDRGSRVCAVMDFVADTATDTGELQRAFTRWAARQHDADVVVRGRLGVRVTACSDAPTL